ncbi:hypothetical protein JTE90_021460 [Oedothorax gibbosus]|uniref:Uncharacterized protein n=1 Tax=Oedothorax gibbosus TaxID=931172 RepID=A0AAV6VXU2_9ARAC|nr:hypothetical protein JTE90_021460 [Oedothorax gibbosus]
MLSVSPLLTENTLVLEESRESTILKITFLDRCSLKDENARDIHGVFKMIDADHYIDILDPSEHRERKNKADVSQGATSSSSYAARKSEADIPQYAEN